MSFDLGLEHTYASGANVKATVFYNKIDNLIGYSAGSYTQVSGLSQTKGLELSGEYELTNGIMLTGSYTYTDSQDAAGKQLVRVPRHDLVIGANTKLGQRFTIGLQANRIAGRANDGFPSRAMPDYSVANATLNYAVSDTSEIYLRVENLFDKEYQTSAGYGTSDRAIYFGVRASF